MLKFILTFLIIGGIIGLLFSNAGEEGSGMLRGMKSGAGCAIKIILLLIVIGAIIGIVALL